MVTPRPHLRAPKKTTSVGDSFLRARGGRAALLLAPIDQPGSGKSGLRGIHRLVCLWRGYILEVAEKQIQDRAYSECEP